MQRIDTSTKFTDLFGPGKHGFRDGNKATFTAPTQLNAAWVNSVQEEPAGVIEGFGITLDKDDNQQMFKAITRGLSGVLSKSVAGGGDVILTAAESMYGVLKLTGVITADINVIVQAAIPFSWTVRNDTTGDFDITVKTVSGTGVVVPRAADTPVYTNGTDVLYGTSIIPQAVAEAGLETVLRGWSALRVRQAAQNVLANTFSTSAEVLAGLSSTTFASPATLLAGLLGAGGTAQTDYVTIPYRDKVSGIRRNFIIQFGALTTGAPNILYTATLPITFPNAILRVIPGHSTSINEAPASVAAFPLSTSQVQLMASLASAQVDYMAIGH